jgi:chemotaxis-related protein WspB
MLLVLFNVGEEVHAIDAASVVEVLPLVDIKKSIGAPRGVAGTFNYRGTFVPVIDLNDLLLGRPVAARLSTRLILARYSVMGMIRLVAVVAENATETLRYEASDITSPGIVTEAAPYLDAVIKSPNGFVQRIDIEKLTGAVLPSLLLSA